MIFSRECCAPGCAARFDVDHADQAPRIYCERHAGRRQDVQPIDPQEDRVPTTCECRACGQPFKPSHHRQSYCSDGCKREGAARRAREAREARERSARPRAPLPAEHRHEKAAPGPPEPDADALERGDRLDDILAGLQRWEEAKVAAGDWTDEDEALRRWVAFAGARRA